MTSYVYRDSDVYRNSEKSFASIYPWLHKISYLEIDFSLFSVRPSNCFRRAHIFKWGDLADKTQTEVFNLPNFGGTSFNEVHKVLKEMSIDWSGIDSFGESEEDILKELKKTTEELREASEKLEALSLPSEVVKWALSTNYDKIGDLVAPILESGPKGSGITDYHLAPPEIQEKIKLFLDLKLENFITELPSKLDSEIIEKFLHSLPDKKRIIFSRRVLSEKKTSYRELAEELGVTHEAVRRQFQRIESEYREKLELDDFSVLRWASDLLKTPGAFYPYRFFHDRNRFVEEVKQIFSTPPPSEDLDDHFSGRRKPFVLLSDDEVRLIMWCAALPKVRDDGWLILNETSFDTDIEKFQNLSETLLTVSRDSFLEKFSEIESPLTMAEGNSLLLIDENVLGFWRGNLEDKSEVVLDWGGKPQTSEEILEEIQKIEKRLEDRGIPVSDYEYSARSIQGRLYGDKRFIRTDKFQRYALAKWGLEEYSGIYQEICERIERGDGKASLTAIIEEFTTEFGVTENSVRMYLGNGTFSVIGDVVRFSEAGFVPRNPTLIANSIETDYGWGEIFEITDDNMKGYSFNFSSDIAYENGIRPDESLMLPVVSDLSWEGESSVIWRSRSTTRTIDVGRLRLLLERDFEIGDRIVIVPTRSLVAVFSAEEHVVNTVSRSESTALDSGWEMEEI